MSCPTVLIMHAGVALAGKREANGDSLAVVCAHWPHNLVWLTRN